MTNNYDYQLSSYHYDLPTELIADRPLKVRHDSRLMVYIEAKDRIVHSTFDQLPQFLSAQDLLVLNQSQVIPSRLFGHKSSGGKMQMLITSLLPAEATKATFYKVMIKSNSAKRVDDRFYFADGNLTATIASALGDGNFLVHLEFSPLFSGMQNPLFSLLKQYGNIPLPPYIRGGNADEQDLEDYQTVYAHRERPGSVAAPTAGLHFTHKVFEKLAKQQIDRAFITLHVGPGTFLPVKSTNILEHLMHSESYSICTSDLHKIASADPLKVIAVGTTSLRVLETIKRQHKLQQQLPLPDQQYTTNIFLYPGQEISSIGGLITNFHLPQSTLLILVSALIGRVKALELYQAAIKERYRFYSYGDAMLILRKPKTTQG